MAWEWSHTVEAYQNVRDNILSIGEKADNGNTEAQEWIREVWCEWESHNPDADDADHEGYSPLLYVQAKQADVNLSYSEMAYIVSHRAERQALCEKGGHKAWACPYGCMCHLISFDRETE